MQVRPLLTLGSYGGAADIRGSLVRGYKRQCKVNMLYSPTSYRIDLILKLDTGIHDIV